MIEIRYMTSDDDRTEISRIYEESWKYAYAGIIPQNYLDSIPEGQWISGLDHPERKTLICVEDSKFVGTSSFGKSRFGQFDDWGEIISIYLLPAYMGKGHGKLLLRAAVSELKNLGYEDAFLWVLEENARARHFYERFGFRQTEDYLDNDIGGKTLREIRYTYKYKNKNVHNRQNTK